MSRVIAALIRHGDYHQLPDTPSAHQPFALNAEGEIQALEAAKRVRSTAAQHDWLLDPVIDSSRLLRAWQTATIMSGQLEDLATAPTGVESFDALAERGLGSAANLSLAQISEVIHRDPRFPELPEGWKSDSHYRLPLQGAESLLEAGVRVATHLQQRMAALARQAGRDTLKLFVGHGAAFRHAACHLGVLEFGQLAQLSMYHGQPVLLEYLPGERWQHIGGEWKPRHSDAGDMD